MAGDPGRQGLLTAPSSHPRTAFVLGGGGKWGAVEVGMLQALVDAGVTPDVVVGCSIGAVNGGAFAADPTPAGIARLARFWSTEAADAVSVSLADRVRSLLGRRAYLTGNDGLRRAITTLLPATFEELVLPFQCVAAAIETATEHWFGAGPLSDAVLASCAVPGLFPPVQVGGTHYYDGGLVNSIPLDRAVALGAERVFVLQVGRVETAIDPPRRLHQAGLVAFEIARRHRFTTSHAARDALEVHLLPSGHRLAADDRRQLAWRRTGDATALMAGARQATATYLRELS